MPHALLLAALLAPAATPQAPALPQLSPLATVSQTIGTTEVKVTYHRPAVRRRKIWGELVPFGKVWRAGANEATTLRFSDPVKVEGHAVAAGTYALFMVPGPDRWTLILNRRWQQLGAYAYDPKDDLLRFEVTPKTVANFDEWLTYEIYPASPSTAYVDMYWEKLRVSFLVEVDVQGIVTARLKKALAQAKPGDWRTFSDAAEYLLDLDKDLAQGLKWIDRSLQIKETPVNLHVKARLQMALGQGPEAARTLERALRLAEAAKAPPEVTGPLLETRSTWDRGTSPREAGNGRR